MPETHQSVTAADGVRLAVTMSGPVDAEPLLLIPGLGAAASVFDPIRPSLDSRYRTVVYDPRGVGASESGESKLTMDLMVSDVAAVLDGTELSSAHVMGASMGGVVAQYFVLEHPDRVARLVLAATSPGGRKPVGADPRATAALLGKGARSPEEAYRMACTVLYSPQFQRTHSEFIEQQIRWRGTHPVRPRVFSAQLAALSAAADITARLAQVRASDPGDARYGGRGHTHRERAAARGEHPRRPHALVRGLRPSLLPRTARGNRASHARIPARLSPPGGVE